MNLTEARALADWHEQQVDRYLVAGQPNAVTDFHLGSVKTIRSLCNYIELYKDALESAARVERVLRADIEERDRRIAALREHRDKLKEGEK